MLGSAGPLAGRLFSIGIRIVIGSRGTFRKVHATGRSFPDCQAASGSGQCGGEVVAEVLESLEAHGKPDESVGDPNRAAGFGGV
jgi:hypothetical protein